MNTRDTVNLKFLLESSAEVIKDWYESVSEDCIEYAMEILDCYQQELNDKSAFIDIENNHEYLH
jgi:hypothetical protein